MLDTSREKQVEIERGWLQHDPARDRIPGEIWRQLRVFKRSIEADADRIDARSADANVLRPLLIDFNRKGAVGRQRALLKFRQYLHPARVQAADKAAVVWSWLKPRHGPVTKATCVLGQDCIVVDLGVGFIDRRQATAFSCWSLEASDHALARLMQRSDRIDLKAALLEASDNFLAADADNIAYHVEAQRVFYLRCGSGLLLTSPIHCRTPRNVRLTYARAHTWIAASMAGADQVPLPPAADPTRSQLMQLVKVAQP